MKAFNKKAISAGHICVDITPVFPENRAKMPADILIPGKLLNVGPAKVSIGGSVANTGLAMKFFGIDVSLMGMVGEDAFGKMILAELQKDHASEGIIVSPKSSTSYSVVLALPGIDRIFLHNPGANDDFCADDIPEEKLEAADLFHFGYPPLMKSVYENDAEELLKIMRRAKAAGCATSLDLAAVDPSSPAGAADWEKILGRVLPFVDIFVPSVEELCFMLDQNRYEEWHCRAEGGDVTEVIDLEQDIIPLAKKAMALGPKILLIKCGTPGIYYETASKAALSDMEKTLELDANLWAKKRGFEKSYVPERVLSGTGAGDTCIGAFLSAVLKGYGPERAMHLAAAAGACCVSAYDARSGLKTFEEMEALIDAHWPKIS